MHTVTVTQKILTRHMRQPAKKPKNARRIFCSILLTEMSYLNHLYYCRCPYTTIPVRIIILLYKRPLDSYRLKLGEQNDTEPR